jgi:hypothetical protein
LRGRRCGNGGRRRRCGNGGRRRRAVWGFRSAVEKFKAASSRGGEWVGALTILADRNFPFLFERSHAPTGTRPPASRVH